MSGFEKGEESDIKSDRVASVTRSRQIDSRISHHFIDLAKHRHFGFLFFLFIPRLKARLCTCENPCRNPTNFRTWYNT